eukprot:TRINITY_DN5098_c0_g1_i2.p1 TRINITY_DN5098_c0_g1~~TRINITY_DN5098_c0_g1_i2.p1  ORF type:complete len:521 (-),score=109.89 TRINITY_DN5098_c0_g1_i2:149-1711(-)
MDRVHATTGRSVSSPRREEDDDEERRSSWYYVVDPEELSPALLRIDPPEQCLCKSCVMNTPQRLDLSGALNRWKIPFRGDFKTALATADNTMLAMVTLIGVSGGTSTYCLSIDGSMTVEDLNLIVSKTSRVMCECCELGSLPPVLFMKSKSPHMCLTPWKDGVQPTDALDDVVKDTDFITLGLFLYKMGLIKPKKAPVEWHNWQMLKRVLWIEAFYLPTVDPTSFACCDATHLEMEFESCDKKNKKNKRNKSKNKNKKRSTKACLTSAPPPSVESDTISIPMTEEHRSVLQSDAIAAAKRKLLDWFLCTVARHSKTHDDNCHCIECSKHETPLAYDWYRWAVTRLSSEDATPSIDALTNLVKGPTIEKLIANNLQWIDLASLAREYYVIHCMACSLIYDKSRSVSITNRPKCSKAKKANKSKNKKNDKKVKNVIVTPEPSTEPQGKDERKSGFVEPPAEEYPDELFASEVEGFRKSLLNQKAFKRVQLQPSIYKSIQDAMKAALSARSNNPCNCSCHNVE